MRAHSKIDRIGEKHLTNEGYDIEIVEYFGANNITIRFTDGTLMHKVIYSTIKNKCIRKPYNRVGEVYKTNNSGYCQIIAYGGHKKCTIQFEDGAIVENVRVGDLKTGSVSNPYDRSVFGVGYYGIGEYSSKHKQALKRWRGMMTRCYYSGSIIKHSSYDTVTVCEEWHNFQNFAKWYYDNYNPEYMEKWEVDKDIKIKGNKVYSPETCLIIPREINTLFKSSKHCRGSLPLGVRKGKNNYYVDISLKTRRVVSEKYSTIEEAFEFFKLIKKEEIKKLADRWKEFLNVESYNYIINYPVEISD